MGFWEKFGGKFIWNTLDAVTLRELKKEQKQLKNSVATVQPEMEKIEKEKNDLFKQGVGADPIKKKMIAQQLKQLDFQGQLKYKGFMTMNKQYVFISCLVIIKQYEKELIQTPIWAKITNIETSKFEKGCERFIKYPNEWTPDADPYHPYRMGLIKDLKGIGFNEFLIILNNALKSSPTDSDNEESMDDAEKQLLDAWSGVETGAITDKDEQKKVPIEKQLE